MLDDTEDLTNNPEFIEADRRLQQYLKKHGCRPEDVEDARQTLYMKSLERPGLWHNLSDLFNFLFHSATNLLTDRYRRRAFRRETSLENFEHPATDANMLFNDLAEKEKRVCLAEVLKRLPPKDKYLWDLMTQDYTAVTIARILNISHAAARTRCHSLRKRVHKAYTEAVRSKRNHEQPEDVMAPPTSEAREKSRPLGKGEGK